MLSFTAARRRGGQALYSRPPIFIVRKLTLEPKGHVEMDIHPFIHGGSGIQARGPYRSDAGNPRTVIGQQAISVITKSYGAQVCTPTRHKRLEKPIRLEQLASLMPV
jgi:hypothetical protein